MKTYAMADESVTDLVAEILSKHYPEHLALRLKVDVLMVSTDEEVSALTVNGYAVKAVTKILGAKDRTAGRADAEIVIDENSWIAMSAAERAALIDHELYHLELVRDKTDRLKRDYMGRPQLTIRLHDHQFGWFDAIAKRHGETSQECQQAQRFHSHAQLYLPFETAV